MSFAQTRPRRPSGFAPLAVLLLLGAGACRTKPHPPAPSDEPNAQNAALRPTTSPNTASAPKTSPNAALAPAPNSVLVAATTSLPVNPSVPVPSLLVPRAARAITPSEEFDVKAWGGAVNTHTLLDADGHGAVPVSEARFLWGQGKLYVSFYAGDLDLQIHTRAHDGPVWRDDAVLFDFPQRDGSDRLIAVSATGVVADASCPAGAEFADPRCELGWESHARAAADYDGTINRIDDRDEEWNVELSLPLAAIGVEKASAGTHIAFHLARCEVAYDGPRQCGRWGTHERPAELVLE